ncbi:MAG: hypothetical protein HY907_01460 [Deltaproteobacteria bacterium]|nr:hypothetical protein [Deltaproteobacteria bacterium]
MKKLLAVVILCAVLVPAFAKAQPAPIVVMPAPAEEYRPVHQLSVGVGAFVCAFGATQWGSGSACISDEFLMLSFPVIYRYRINDYLAAGGGLMIHVFNIPEFGFLAGAEGVGSFRAYAVPDWLYFEANILFGFPVLFAFMPSVGVSIPLGPLSIFFENQVPLFFFGGVTGWWQPVLGVEFAF